MNRVKAAYHDKCKIQSDGSCGYNTSLSCQECWYGPNEGKKNPAARCNADSPTAGMSKLQAQIYADLVARGSEWSTQKELRANAHTMRVLVEKGFAEVRLGDGPKHKRYRAKVF